MKNGVFIFCLFISIPALLFAHVPDRFSFQAVVRNANGDVVAVKNVGVRIQLLLGSQTGTVVYAETHQTVTNAAGLFSIEIGGGTSVKGKIGQIDWGAGTYYLKAEIDPTGGDNYTITTVSQILSVPYARHAAVADSAIKTNVINSEWINPTHYIKDTVYGIWGFSYTIDDPRITQDVVDKGSVMVYGNLSAYDKYLWSHTQEQAGILPVTIIYIQNNILYTDRWTASVSLGKIKIRFTDDHNLYLNGIAAGANSFRYVIMPAR